MSSLRFKPYLTKTEITDEVAGIKRIIKMLYIGFLTVFLLPPYPFFIKSIPLQWPITPIELQNIILPDVVKFILYGALFSIIFLFICYILTYRYDYISVNNSSGGTNEIDRFTEIFKEAQDFYHQYGDAIDGLGDYKASLEKIVSLGRVPTQMEFRQILNTRKKINSRINNKKTMDKISAM